MAILFCDMNFDGGGCAPLPIQRSASIYTESRKSPEVKSFITDRKIIIELGYELLGYTFGFCLRGENSAGERGADRGYNVFGERTFGWCGFL